MKHVLIIELSYTGHFFIYMERIASAYLNTGFLVTITIRQQFQNHALTIKLKTNFPENLRLNIITDKEFNTAARSLGGNIGGELANWLLFRKKFIEINSQTKVDYVFLPYVDYCMHMIGLLGSPFGHARWSGICMLASVHHARYKFLNSTTRLNWIKRFSFFRLLRIRSLNTLFTIDELLLKFVLERDVDLGKRLQYLADPAELKGDHTREAARKLLNIPEETVVILVYGAVNARKGLDVLVKALCHPSVLKLFSILIVGEQDGSIDYLFKSKEVEELANNGRICVVNKFVDDAMQQMVFAATDIVWLGYRNHFSSSGVLVLAALARKVVIATNDGLIGWHTRERRLGVAVDIGDIVAVRKALVDFCDDSIRLKLQQDIDPIFDEHTWDNAVERILSTSAFV